MIFVWSTGQHLARFLSEDDSARKPEVGRVAVPVVRKLAVGKIIAHSAAIGSPFFIKRGHSEKIRDIDLLDKLQGFLRNLVHESNTARIQGLLAARIDRYGNASYEVGLGMRILGAKKRLHPDHIPLPFQGLKIMSYSHEVCFRRQFVGRVAPVGVGKHAELAAVRKGLTFCCTPLKYEAEDFGQSEMDWASEEVLTGSAFRELTMSTQSRACR